MFIRDVVNDGVLPALEKMLAFTQARHRVLAENIANVDTPGYKADRVEFEAELQEALAAGRSLRGPTERRLARVREARTHTTKTEGALRRDGNNVSIEDEVARLGRTSLIYQAVARVLAKRLSMLRVAISEGSKQ